MLQGIKNIITQIKKRTSRGFRYVTPLVLVFTVTVLPRVADVAQIYDVFVEFTPANHQAAVGGADHPVFGGEWTDYNHEIVCDGNIVMLKSDSTTAMLDYDEKIPLGSDIHLSMIPLGGESVNIGYGRRTLYEFMFGDGDRDSISLKYDVDGDGLLEKVSLRKIQSDLPFADKNFLDNPLVYSQEVSIIVREELISRSQIRFRITIDGAMFESDVLPLVNSETYNRVYIALVDFGGEGMNKTAAEFPELRICR